MPPAVKSKKPAKVEEVREVLYPEVKVEIRDKDDPITVAYAKELLKWQTEEEYSKDALLKNPKAKEKATSFGEEFLLKDLEGNKVRCWNNSQNRPFAEPWAKQLAQDVLTRQWRFNCETIIVSKTGTVLSGQHRLLGLILAGQLWAAKKHLWEAKWPEEPTIESLVAFGAEEDPDYLRTLDNVKPRSLSDVLFTSEYFSKLGTFSRRECSRMLDVAMKLLWKRTGAGLGVDGKPDPERYYQSHSTSLSFIDRHPKLLKAIKTIFDLNNPTKFISNIDLSPGTCAGLLYLMGTCTSDSDEYKNMQEPGEKGLSFDRWKDAETFFTMLAKDEEFNDVRKALKSLINVETGQKPTMEKKVLVLCKAWEQYISEDPDLSEEAVGLGDDDYFTDDDGSIALRHKTISVGGIDLVKEDTADEETSDTPPTEEEIKEKKAEERKKKAEEATEKIKGMRNGKGKTNLSKKELEERTAKAAAEDAAKEEDEEETDSIDEDEEEMEEDEDEESDDEEEEEEVTAKSKK